MTIRWYGLLAPEEMPTGDGRMFAAQGLTYREFPLRAAWQRVSGRGHDGAVVVGSWNGQYQGQGGVWGAGEFLDPTIVPEVLEAVYLIEKKLIGPSVDLDPRPLAYEVVEDPTSPDDTVMKITRGNVNGVTFVMAPAFPQVHITVDTEEEMAVLASAGITMAEFSVNSKAWDKFPLAPRETRFDADTAIQNIAAWSGGDAAKFGSAFLWKDDEGNPLNRETYRLPIVDIFDGKAYLVPRAVFSAGVIMSGGHGGLYDTLSEGDRIKVQEVLTDIYDMLRQEYGDPRVVAPWQRGGRQGATSADAEPSRTAGLESEEFQMLIDLSMASEEFQSRLGGELEDYWVRGKGAAKIRWGTPGSFDRCVRALRDKFPQDTEGLCANLHHEATGKWPAEGKDRGEHSMDDEDFAVRSSGWSSMPTSEAAWDEGAARRALNTWAGDDMSKYGRAFLWSDGSGNKTGFKFPIAKPVDGKLTIFIHAVNNAKARLSQADIPAADKTRIEGILNSIQKRYGGEGEQASLTAAGILAPHSSLFDDPKLTGYTGLQVTTDGRVFGHLAPWGQCHLGVGNKCTMLPRSATGYAYFKQGSVHTSDGKQLRVGKITIGTGHADERFGVVPAREHYDNTGACVAVVNAGEDSFGVWVAGAVVDGVTEQTLADLRRSPLSGDWRRVNGNLELVGALAVNYPGFPILHEDADGQYSLVAGGYFEPDGGVDQPEASAEVGDAVGFTAVDSFLAQVAGAERAASIAQAFQDLLPPQEGCGCGV